MGGLAGFPDESVQYSVNTALPAALARRQDRVSTSYATIILNVGYTNGYILLLTMGYTV